MAWMGEKKIVFELLDCLVHLMGERWSVYVYGCRMVLSNEKKESDVVQDCSMASMGEKKSVFEVLDCPTVVMDETLSRALVRDCQMV
jgi:hypothetical protein